MTLACTGTSPAPTIPYVLPAWLTNTFFLPLSCPVAPGYGNPDYLQLLQDKYTYLGLKTYSQNRAGTILLNSTDPHAQAKIDFKQFEQGADQVRLRLGSSTSPA